MDSDLERALAALRRASEAAANLDVRVTDEYLRLIQAVEALPQNQPGADKSGRWLGSREWWRFVREGHVVKPRT